MNKNKILITGGGGYIGSHLICALKNDPNNDIHTLDNFTTGHLAAIKHGKVHNFDISDITKLEKLFTEHSFQTV